MIELSVADVRAALARSAGDVAGSGHSATLLLGRLFHESFADLLSVDPVKSGLRVITEAPLSEEQRVASLLEHGWRQLVAPRLRRHGAALQTSSEQVLLMWRAHQNLSRWLVKVVMELLGRSSQPRESWQHLTELLRSEVPLECELRETSWKEPVRLVGVADSILRAPGSSSYCAIELKLGRCAPVIDLAQAALYHLILSRSGRSAPHSALALLRFSPELEERLVEAEAIGEAQEKLLQVIAELAQVGSTHGKRRTTNARPSSKPRARDPRTRRENEPTPPAPGATHEADSNGQRRGGAQDLTPQRDGPPSVAPDSRPSPPEGYVELTRRLIRAYKEQGVGIEIREAPQAGARFLRFSVRLASGMRVDAVRRHTAEVQHRLELAKEPMVTQEAGHLFVDVERPDPQTVLFSSIAQQLPPVDVLTGSARVPIGVDAARHVHWTDLSSAGRSHLLAAGTTGSGKSEWLRMMMAGLMCSNTPDTLRFVTIDPKLAAFGDLENSKYLWTKDAWWIPGTGRPASEVFDDLLAEMERRYQLTRTSGTDNLRDHVLATRKPLPRIVCVCDEYFALIAQSKEEGKAIEAAVAMLGAKARAAGIHLVLATQQPSRKVINGNIQSNLLCRVALMLQSPIESRMILNVSGAERLTGAGDLLYKDFGDPVRLQAPYLPPEERAKWLRR